LKSLGSECLHASYVAKVALWMESDTDWALSLQSGQPKWKYGGELIAWHGILSAMHAGIAIVDLSQGLEGYKVLCAPLPYMVSSQQTESIRQFVQGGGTFITGPRFNEKGPRNQVVARPLARFRDLLGVDLLDDEPIYSETQGVQFHGSLGSQKADCHFWSDVLDPQGAEVLGTFTSGRAAGKAAITSHAFGKGRAVYLGAHLDPADLARVLGVLLSADGVLAPIQTPPGVETTSRRSGNRTWHYVLNHTAATQSIHMQGQFKDHVTNARFNGSIDLGPNEVCVLEQS
jgi:beta-galactosidase